jgi:hypothetical protein
MRLLERLRERHVCRVVFQSDEEDWVHVGDIERRPSDGKTFRITRMQPLVSQGIAEALGHDPGRGFDCFGVPADFGPSDD